jgi:hypothetical protein
VAVAVLLDTMSWAGPGSRVPRNDFDGAAALLRASGWRIVTARAGDTIADVWPQAGRRHHDAELTSIPTGAR